MKDPLASGTVSIAGRSYPLAADFSIGTAALLANDRPQRLGFIRMIRPGKYAATARLVRLQPYDPNKIPVLMTHGLQDTPATWAPLLNELRSDPEINKHYQFWVFSYPSDHVAFSIELRRQVDQEYSTLAGLYKTYGLIYLVGDERDLVRVRTNYRKEDIYLYRTVTKPARARAIFLDYLRSLNALHEHPEFYNELTSNCTTNVRVHTAATAVGKPPPWDWRLLINGYADQMLYERGDLLIGQMAFADLKKQALVNEKAKAANDDPDFSRRIRDGVIGF